MLVKATVILDVEDVKTWEEAYETVFSFPGHCMSAFDSGKHRSAYFRRIVRVEGVPKCDPIDNRIGPNFGRPISQRGASQQPTSEIGGESEEGRKGGRMSDQIVDMLEAVQRRSNTGTVAQRRSNLTPARTER